MIIQMPSRTYRARLVEVPCGDVAFKLAGTLDGFIDFAMPGGGGTYSLSTAEAENLATALLRVICDVKINCLYDRDALLRK